VITDQVLGIVYRVIDMHPVMKAGYSKKDHPHWWGNDNLKMTALGVKRSVIASSRTPTIFGLRACLYGL
jgi:hypothetical protein